MPTTNSSTILTFAEMAFLMSLVGDADRATACRRLGVPNVEESAELAMAGLASLAARGLAAAQSDELTLSSDLAAISVGIVSAQVNGTLGIASPGVTDILQVFCGEVQSLTVRPLAFGCFRIDGLASEVTTSGLMSTLFEALISEDAGQMAVIAKIDGIDGEGVSAVRSANGALTVYNGQGSEQSVEKADLVPVVRELLDHALT
jgi:hypothetical protein